VRIDQKPLREENTHEGNSEAENKSSQSGIHRYREKDKDRGGKRDERPSNVDADGKPC
jgi:hypothetical protein